MNVHSALVCHAELTTAFVTPYYLTSNLLPSHNSLAPLTIAAVGCSSNPLLKRIIGEPARWDSLAMNSSSLPHCGAWKRHFRDQHDTLRRHAKLRQCHTMPVSDLNHPILQRANAIDTDADDVIRLQGEISRRHDAGTGQQDGASGITIAASQIVDQFGYRAFDLVGRNRAAENFSCRRGLSTSGS